MKMLNPYMNSNGNAREALNAHKSVPGGEFPMVIGVNDARGADGYPPADMEKIRHTTPSTGKGNVPVAIGAPESMRRPLPMEIVFHWQVNTESEQETNNLSDAHSAGWKIGVPLQKIIKKCFGGRCSDSLPVRSTFNAWQMMRCIS